MEKAKEGRIRVSRANGLTGLVLMGLLLTISEVSSDNLHKNTTSTQIHSGRSFNSNASSNHTYLEDATDDEDFRYELTKTDIQDTARIHYDFRLNVNFAVVVQEPELESYLTRFVRNTPSTFTLIINLAMLGDKHHWATLVLDGKKDRLRAYYVDSMGHVIPEKLFTQLEKFHFKTAMISERQLTDHWNCGLFALENAKIITRMINESSGIDIDIGKVKSELKKLSTNSEEFKSLRIRISKGLRSDSERQKAKESRQLSGFLHIMDVVGKGPSRNPKHVEFEKRAKKPGEILEKIQSGELLNDLSHESSELSFSISNVLIRQAFHTFKWNGSTTEPEDGKGMISLTEEKLFLRGVLEDDLHQVDDVFQHLMNTRRTKRSVKRLSTLKTLSKGITKVAIKAKGFAKTAYDLHSLINPSTKGSDPNAFNVSQTIMTVKDLAGGAINLTKFFKAVLAGKAVLNLMQPLQYLVTVALQVYEGIARVQEIEREIPLTTREKTREFFRGFLGLDMSHNMQRLIQTSRSNEEQINAVMELLTRYQEIARCVVPSFRLDGKVIKLSENSLVYLDKREMFRAERTVPMDDERVICRPRSPKTQNKHMVNSYRCENAIGVEYQDRRKGNITFIALQTGNDTAVGSRDNQNYFLIESGTKRFVGGEKGDIFYLKSGPVFGYLDAKGGENVLVVDGRFAPQMTLAVDLYKGLFHDMYNKSVITFSKVNQIIGRKHETEKIVADCDTTFIMSGGGTFIEPDEVLVPDYGEDCVYQLEVEMHPWTIVRNLAVRGNFRYRIPDPYTSPLPLKFTTETNFTLQVDFAAGELGRVLLEHSKIEIEYVTKRKPSTLFVYLQNKTSDSGRLLLHTNDHFLLTLDKEEEMRGIRFLNGEFTSLVNGFKNLKNIFQIVQGMGKQTLVGGSRDDIFFLDGAFRGTLDGQEGENQLVVSRNFSTANTVEFDLRRRVLNPSKDQIDLFGIKNVFGREGAADKFISACETRSIHGRGSELPLWDEILVPQDSCFYELHIFVEENTRVVNNARRGNFTYAINSQGSADIELLFLNEGNHFWSLKDRAKNLDVVFDKSSGKIIFANAKGEIIRQRMLKSGDKTEDFSQPIFHTSDSVQIKVDSQGNVKGFVRMTQTNPRVKGLLRNPNVVIISTGNQNFSASGGQDDDDFLLETTPCTGVIHGNAGANSLILADTFLPVGVVRIDFDHHILATETNDMVRFSNITSFVGREHRSENIQASCDLVYVNSKGGDTQFEPDKITIPQNSDCDYNLTIIVSGSTTISNQASAGEFYYMINKFSSANLTVDFTPETEHYFLLDNTLSDIVSLSYSKKDSIFTFTDYSESEVTLHMKSHDRHPDPKIKTVDDFTISIGRDGHIVAKKIIKNEQAMEKLILDYRFLAERFDIAINIFVKEKLIQIGDNFDILTSDPLWENHLVGRNGQQIYVINARENLQITPDVIVHNFDQDDTLDLTKIVKRIREKMNTTYVPEIFEDGLDLLIPIHAGGKPIVNVRLMNIKEKASKGRLWVVLSETAMEIKRSFNQESSTVHWYLQPATLLLPADKGDIFLTRGDIENGLLLALENSKSGPQNFQLAALKNSLIITDICTESATSFSERKSIVLKDFFVDDNQEIFEKISIKFRDERAVELPRLLKTIGLKIEDYELLVSNYRDLLL